MNLLLCTIAIIITSLLIWRVATQWFSLRRPLWILRLIEMNNPFTQINSISTVMKHLNLQPGMSVLDVGCGSGRISIPASNAVGNDGYVLAMDVAPQTINLARRQVMRENIGNIDFFQADAGTDKLGKNRFDRVVMVSVLGEIKNKKYAMEQIFESLKPGGILSITELIFDPHFQKHNRIARLADRAGFDEKAIYGHRFAYSFNFKKPAANEKRVRQYFHHCS